MELTNYYPIEEISNKNACASKNDKNSSEEYEVDTVLRFMDDNGDKVAEIVSDILASIELDD